MKNKSIIYMALGVIAIIICADICWYCAVKHRAASSTSTKQAAAKLANRPLKRVIDVYNAGKYLDAEKAAERLIQSSIGSKDLLVR